MEPRRDRRVRRTRAALIGAFNHLLLAGRRRQRDITVAEITDAADIGRSTFYEHYSSADAIFLDAANHPFGILADAITGNAEPGALTHLLEHFWENRQLARDTLVRLDGQITRLLAGKIEDRLTAAGATPAIPMRLAALQLAEAALAPIRGWVTAEAPCAADTLAGSLERTSAAMLGALTTR